MTTRDELGNLRPEEHDGGGVDRPRMADVFCCSKSIHCFLGEGHEGRCRDSGLTADGVSLDPAFLRLIRRDGQEVILARCPGCGSWAELDDDQLHGRVSTHHDEADGGCGFHLTVNWWDEHTSPPWGDSPETER